MALEKAITHKDNGVAFLMAYHRVEIVTLTKGSAQIAVRVYGSAAVKDRSWVEARDKLVTGADFTTYFGDLVYVGGTTNPIRQAYLWLKTLPEYAGALDV